MQAHSAEQTNAIAAAVQNGELDVLTLWAAVRGYAYRKARRWAVHDMQVIIENTIMPSLKLLAEGQKTILETMTPKTRVDELEDEMQLLKAVIRSQSERIAALEKRLA